MQAIALCKNTHKQEMKVQKLNQRESNSIRHDSHVQMRLTNLKGYCVDPDVHVKNI